MGGRRGIDPSKSLTEAQCSRSRTFEEALENLRPVVWAQEKDTSRQKFENCYKIFVHTPEFGRKFLTLTFHMKMLSSTVSASMPVESTADMMDTRSFVSIPDAPAEVNTSKRL